MRDSPIAASNDQNPILTMRRYRRANQVTAPKLVCGCGS
jgi:hypothetical protein